MWIALEKHEMGGVSNMANKICEQRRTHMLVEGSLAHLEICFTLYNNILTPSKF